MSVTASVHAAIAGQTGLSRTGLSRTGLSRTKSSRTSFALPERQKTRLQCTLLLRGSAQHVFALPRRRRNAASIHTKIARQQNIGHMACAGPTIQKRPDLYRGEGFRLRDGDEEHIPCPRLKFAGQFRIRVYRAPCSQLLQHDQRSSLRC